MNNDEFQNKIEESKITNQNPVNQAWWSDQPRNSVRKAWFFDVQWSDCPDFVEDEVRRMWYDWGLGNDNSFRMVKLGDEEDEVDYPIIMQWLRYKGVPEDEEVIVHWWW